MRANSPPIVPDLLRANLKLVFCGTAPSAASAAARAYYAHPGNYFWRTLHTVGLTPRRLRPREYPELLEYDIGLTDVAKHHSGNDAQLPAGAFDAGALHQRIDTYRPALLAFTSKNAAQACYGHKVAYGEQSEPIGNARVFVLTSPSGQARRFWNIDIWHALAQAYRALPQR